MRAAWGEREVRYVLVLVLLLPCGRVAVATALPDTLAGLSDQAGLEAVAPSGDGGRKELATGIVGGILVGSLISSYNDWWKDNSRSFHFIREGLFSDYSLGVDKLGHAYTSSFFFHAFRNVMLWGAFDDATATWWAAGTSAFFALSVEVGDGLSSYGFSLEDIAFNFAGLGFGLAQTQFPFLENFQFKWSYVPSGGYRWPPRFTDHYDAHTYWLTVNVHAFLPEEARSWWPPFLHLAFGYGVDELQTRREFLVGLDIHLGGFDIENPEMRLLMKTASMYHLPSPAVKITDGKGVQFLPLHLR